MLSVDLPGVDGLRAQAKTARVIGRCECGCSTVYLSTQQTSDASAGDAIPRVVALAASRDPRFTHLMLWVDGQYLSGIELAWLDGPPKEFPPPDLFDPPEPFRSRPPE